MVTILELPDDCTRLVFDYFSLNEMIQLRRVCPAWNGLITTICAKKQTLYIFFDHTVVTKYLSDDILGNRQQFSPITKQNTLIISKQTKYFASSPAGLNRTCDGSFFCELTNNPKIGFRFVIRLFSNVSVFIYELRQNLMNEMNYLLWKWSANLETLVVFRPNEPKPWLALASSFRVFEESLEDFWYCLEQMGSLRRLNLHTFDVNFELPNNNNRIIATLGQLEEFTFDNRSRLLEPFYAQLKNCTHLRVGQHSWDRNGSSSFIELNVQQTVNLTHLSLYFNERPLHISQQCEQFHNLTYLEILDRSQYFSRSPSSFLQPIQALPKLKTLALQLSLLKDEFENWDNYNTIHPEKQNSPEAMFQIFHNTISELHLISNVRFNSNRFSSFSIEPHECQQLTKSFPKLGKICFFTNQIDKSTFEAQFRPHLSETFGTRIEVEFNRIC